MSRRIIKLLFTVVLLCAIGFAGKMELEDVERENRHFCAMVESGTWPDYRGTASVDCAVYKQE
ncbi:hypothetical protein [Microcystis phage Me-ZS1]|nr:hypothetical protein [Microcystis phage Me-ZS1]